MKKSVNSVLTDKEVIQLINEIGEQFEKNWVVIHAKVLETTRKSSCFKNFQGVKRLNRDGSVTELIRATFKDLEYGTIYMLDLERIYVGTLNNFMIHEITIKEPDEDNEFKHPCEEPEEVVFYVL